MKLLLVFNFNKIDELKCVENLILIAIVVMIVVSVK